MHSYIEIRNDRLAIYQMLIKQLYYTVHTQTRELILFINTVPALLTFAYMDIDDIVLMNCDNCIV